MTNAKYLKLFVDCLERCQKLNDAEFGRLIRAALSYKATGVEVRLMGREEILWDGIKLDIDRDNENYANIINQRTAAGRKGAASRWQKDNKNSKCHLPYGKNDQDKDEDKEKDKDNKENSPNGEQKKVAADADAIFAEVYQAWERASGKCASIAQSEELQTLLEEHGRENMLYAIKQGVNHNAVTLAYIKAVLRGGKRDNKGSGKRDKQEKSYIPNKQGKFADIADDLL